MDKKSLLAHMAMVGVTGTPVPPGLRGNDPKIVILDDLYPMPSPSGRMTHTDPMIQYLEFNPVTNQVEVEGVSHETFFNTDYSELERRFFSNLPDLYDPQRNIMMDIKTVNPDSMPIEDDYLPDPVDNSFYTGPRFKRYAQTEIQKPHKIAEAKRKRRLNKANRKRARS